MDIANDGTGDHETGNYIARLQGREVSITGHRRSDGAWALVRRAVEALDA